MNSFKELKQRKLHADDLSRKGEIDAPIKDLVNFINEQEHPYFTTSSCSGRVIVVAPNENSNRKQGCNWIFTSHGKVEASELCQAVFEKPNNTILKFEPFILHVQCQRVEDARILHCAAVSAGFRNSGITIGKKGKVMVAVRSTHGLEVPLADGGQLLVTTEYLNFLVKIANDKMAENKIRIQRFHGQLVKALSASVSCI